VIEKVKILEVKFQMYVKKIIDILMFIEQDFRLYKKGKMEYSDEKMKK